MPTTVALELTLRWQQSEPPSIKKPIKGETKRANGRVLRALRRRTHGLLLIYPVLPPVEVPDGRRKGGRGEHRPRRPRAIRSSAWRSPFPRATRCSAWNTA